MTVSGALRAGVVLALAGVSLLAVEAGRAHGRSTSYSSLDLDPDGARLRVRIELLELSRIPRFGASVANGDPRVGEYLATRLRLLRDGRPCPVVEGPRPLSGQPGWSVHEWRVACPAGARVLESTLLREVAPSHLHFVRVRDAAGDVRERVLSFRTPRWEVDPPAAGSPDAGDGGGVPAYVALGIEHIASGVDHIAFVLALILLSASVGEVATLVTGFTLAHSVTLALAALGWVRPEAGAVEALIGFSVALVGVENGWLLAGRTRALPWLLVLGLVALALPAALGVGTLSPPTLLGLALFSGCHFALLRRVERPARLRGGVAFAFGLVHGFGFAGVLGQLGLPAERVVPALFGFNVGVELGQLAIVGVTWPLLRWLSSLRRGSVGRAIAELASAIVCALGVYWFVSRGFLS